MNYVISDTTLITWANALRTATGRTDTLTISEMTDIARQFNLAGIEVNFDVVGGTTQPNNPMENTIWVNTDTYICTYSMINTVPTWEAGEGAVCFTYMAANAGISGQINILKQNEISVKVLSCYQYINGEWINKDAKIYIDGNWMPLEMYLTENMWLDATEAFYQSGQSFTTKNVVFDNETQTLQCTLQHNSDSWIGWYRHHNTPIDTGVFNKISIELVTPSTFNWYIYICSSKGAINSPICSLPNLTTGTYELDVPKNTTIYISEYYLLPYGAANSSSPFKVKLKFKTV